MKRAVLSVSDNIGEGASRKSDVERRRFYEIARSSLVEVDNCLEVIICLGMLTKKISEAEKLIEEDSRILSAMIRPK